MGGVLASWLAAVAIAAIAFPVSARLFRRFPDAGAGLSFALGLVLVSFAYFTLRVARILPEGRAGYFLAILLLALLSAWFLREHGVRELRWRWPAALIAVGLFSFAFFGAVAVRSKTPEIVGTEQPMDFMYLNAALTSPEYPPHDPWLSGERSSYYYFGYIQVSVLTATAGVPASQGYTFGLAYTFASAATAGMSVILALARWSLPRPSRKWIPSAPVAGLAMLLLAGSLVAVFEWAAAHGHMSQSLFEFFGVDYRISCEVDPRDGCFAASQAGRTTHWYPDQFFFATFFSMTRHIPNTITEFPIFSFLLGDLHPHVTALPLVILSLGFAAVTWRGREPIDWQVYRKRPVESAIVVIVFGALAFQNAWDILTFTFVYALAVLARNLTTLDAKRALVATGSYLGPLAVAAVVIYLPWYLDFSSQASGIRPYVGAGSTPSQVFLQWGPVLFAGLLPLAALRREDRKTLVEVAPFTLWIPLAPLAAWAALAAYYGNLGDGVDARTSAGWFTLAGYGLVIFLLGSGSVALAIRRHPAAIVAAMSMTGVLLLFGSELLLIKDVFFGGAPRLNTVFKLSYQAWVLLSIAGGAGVAMALGRRGMSLVTRSAAVVGGALIMLGCVYALTGIPNRTSGFSQPGSVDGLAFLATSDPDEYGLTQWVIENVPAGDVVVEATGRTWRIEATGNRVMTEQGTDYTDSGRIAARTGRQTVIGWYFHEIQWRGDTPSVATMLRTRQDAVDAAYMAGSDRQLVLDTMAEYGARYLVVGRVELSRYPRETLPDFGSFMDVVFESGELRVYQVRETRVAGGS